MKNALKFYSLASLLLFACGPSAEEKAAFEKRKQDSIDFVKRQTEAEEAAVADSIAAGLIWSKGVKRLIIEDEILYDGNVIQYGYNKFPGKILTVREYSRDGKLIGKGSNYIGKYTSYYDPSIEVWESDSDTITSYNIFGWHVEKVETPIYDFYDARKKVKTGEIKDRGDAYYKEFYSTYPEFKRLSKELFNGNKSIVGVLGKYSVDGSNVMYKITTFDQHYIPSNSWINGGDGSKGPCETCNGHGFMVNSKTREKMTCTGCFGSGKSSTGDYLISVEDYLLICYYDTQSDQEQASLKVVCLIDLNSGEIKFKGTDGYYHNYSFDKKVAKLFNEALPENISNNVALSDSTAQEMGGE